MLPPRSVRLRTKRLELRPTESSDAARAFEIQSDWAVTRMLSLATWPADLSELARWFAQHEQEWLEGKAFRFAVERNGRFIGVADLDNVSSGEASLGYWLDQREWGRGFASEAAAALRDFALRELELRQLRASHAIDNPASGRVLEKLGFRYVGDTRLHSRPRGADVIQRVFVLNAG